MFCSLSVRKLCKTFDFSVYAIEKKTKKQPNGIPTVLCWWLNIGPSPTLFNYNQLTFFNAQDEIFEPIQHNVELIRGAKTRCVLVVVQQRNFLLIVFSNGVPKVECTQQIFILVFFRKSSWPGSSSQLT